MEPINRTCPTQKMCFRDREAAEKFEMDANARHPERARQHAYACEECAFFHLTAQSPESRSLVSSRIYQSVAPATQRSQYAEKHEQIVSLKKGGAAISEIVEKTGVPYQNVYQFLVQRGLHTPSPTVSTLLRSTSKGPQIVDKLDEQEKQMLAQLEAIRARKAAAIEESRLKIFAGNHMMDDENSGIDKDVVVIKKYGQFLRLSVEDAAELLGQLAQYLEGLRKAA